MEKFRLKQAQSLLKDASKLKTSEIKLKTPKEGFINVYLFENILNLLIEAEEFIYVSLQARSLKQGKISMKSCLILELLKRIILRKM